MATTIFVRYEMKNVKCGTIFQNDLAIGDSWQSIWLSQISSCSNNKHSREQM